MTSGEDVRPLPGTEFPLLQGIPASDLRRLFAASRLRKFRGGEVLFHEGDPADSVHLVRKGRVAVRVGTRWGDTATLDILGPGSIVGELALLSPEERRSATVQALEPSETIVLHRDAFTQLRTDHPSVAEILIRILAGKVLLASTKLVEALYTPAEMRVLARLADLVEIYDSGDVPVVVPLTQEELAELAGTTRATVNRALRKRQEDGSIRLRRGRVEVLDSRSIRPKTGASGNI